MNTAQSSIGPYLWLGFIITVVGFTLAAILYFDASVNLILVSALALALGIGILVDNLKPTLYRNVINRAVSGQERFFLASTFKEHSNRLVWDVCMSSMSDKPIDETVLVESRWIRYFSGRALAVGLLVATGNLTAFVIGGLQLYIYRTDIYSVILWLYQLAFLLSSIGLFGVAAVAGLSRSRLLLEHHPQTARWLFGNWLWIADKAMYCILASIIVLAVGVAIRLSLFYPLLRKFVA